MFVEILTIILMHIVTYAPLWLVCENKSIFLFGLLLLIQMSGLILFIYFYPKGDMLLAFGGAAVFIYAVINTLLIKNKHFVAGKAYSGIKLYLLLINTDLKYILGLYLLSLYIYLYHSPSHGFFEYSNLTMVLALLLSIPMCKRMNSSKSKITLNN